ncbi:hypothetical protein LV85_04191 [Algoriphagus chordae]|uniref:Uncharacterized protein n=1 Tax=Algoriphagus chordae TaxID=237019 RepID=A0A2W7QT08_9BACT|nr:hypothetical protein LV85_04191 [Algoriphagus chordae]
MKNCFALMPSEIAIEYRVEANSYINRQHLLKYREALRQEILCRIGYQLDTDELVI